MSKFAPTMIPAPGERWLRFVGDQVCFSLRDTSGARIPETWQARLRTNLGRDAVLRQEILHARTRRIPLHGASWRDLPMRREGDTWHIALNLVEPGWFQAKAFFIDEHGAQHWPWGANVGISVHPDSLRTGNTIYCAFTRLFGATKSIAFVRDSVAEANLHPIDAMGYAVIPPSGKLRDLTRVLPHIHTTLGCRILHLLPVNPTPTTYARFGRYGSPYASQDLTAIDPALVEFDKRTTALDQFRELTDASHGLGGRVFIDLVTNHTGWGATVQEAHPEWYLRGADGQFVSPGAWGTIWEDLVELSHKNIALWNYLAEVFLTWCRRGVDGFRCDAGYMVPTPAWQYITARVREEFPEAVFLLEGLGGAWEATESILSEGGMQWAYSELFQNYYGRELSSYLDHAFRQSQRVGLLVHYSETHDNPRLAAQGQPWSLLRNRLCALASVSGGFGFTGGVEWLAAERINVHNRTGLNWGASPNLVTELGRLNQLLAEHPCFFDGARVQRLSVEDSPVLVLRRDSAEGKDTLLILMNLRADRIEKITLPEKDVAFAAAISGPIGFPEQTHVLNSGLRFHDLLGQSGPAFLRHDDGNIVFTLGPGATYCLAPTPEPVGLQGAAYRAARARAAWALQFCGRVMDAHDLGPFDWQQLAALVEESSVEFLGCLPRLDSAQASRDLLAALQSARAQNGYPAVVVWEPTQSRRVTLVPPDHWLLIRHPAPFRVTRHAPGADHPDHATAIPAGGGEIAAFAPAAAAGDGTLELEVFDGRTQRLQGALRFLAATPTPLPSSLTETPSDALALLTNEIGGMARVCLDLGRVTSKYDCILGANLNPRVPVDRQILVKRLRVWVNADGFIGALNGDNLVAFEPGAAPLWRFVASAGDGRALEIHLRMWMTPGENTTVIRFERPPHPPAIGKEVPPACDVRLTVRFDLEDRNFHAETKRNGGAEFHFSSNSQPLLNLVQDPLRVPPSELPVGFEFTPAPDRQLRVFALPSSSATSLSARQRVLYHHEAEWSENIPHPIEASRGQEGCGDAFSPGWFELPLGRSESVTLIATTEREPWIPGFTLQPEHAIGTDDFAHQIMRAARQFVVRRDSGKTVIAGYPWFLDWGRDSLICARGLLAAGMENEVRQLLLTFARFEKDGTLPNTIHGDDASNRDTSDAPLWFGVACEELAALEAKDTAMRAGMYEEAAGQRTIADVLRSIAEGYLRGTPNGIRVDSESGLVWSPSHFTWMDTNHPASTPREGYPVEIQVLWVQLLRQLERIGAPQVSESWAALAERARSSLLDYFWLPDQGWLSDQLIAGPGMPASRAVRDTALRGNGLLAVSFGLLTGERARRLVEAAAMYLVVPGGLRSLAPLPVSPPLPIHARDGRLLNDPQNPYWGRYEGDEDTSRKLAYHNGTAWTWTFPVFCEALAQAWDFSPGAVAAARSYLGSLDRLLAGGCLGQIPEIMDGDAPHQPRGCDAQAWGVTEALRVWRLLASRQATPTGFRPSSDSNL